MKKWGYRLLAVMLCASLLALPALGEPEDIDPSLTQLAIHMDTVLEGSTVRVTMQDESGGVVVFWPVTLTVDGTDVAQDQYSDETGQVVFEDMVPEGASSVSVTALSAQIPGTNVYLVGGTVDVLNNAPTTTQTQESTSDTTPSTEAPSDSPAHGGTATTAVKNDLIGVPVEADTVELERFGLTESEFAGRAHMWMEPALYDSMVSDSGGSLVLSLSLNPTAATSETLIAAKNATPEYAGFSDDQVIGFALDFSVWYRNGGEQVQISPSEGTYQIELPIPESMVGCEKMAVAVCTAQGLTSFVELTPSAGTVVFTIQRFQTLAIVGFHPGAGTGNPSQTPMALILLGILGALLIAGGIALLVFVVFQRRKRRTLSDISSESGDMADAEIAETPEPAPFIPEEEPDEFSFGNDSENTFEQQQIVPPEGEEGSAAEPLRRPETVSGGRKASAADVPENAAQPESDFHKASVPSTDNRNEGRPPVIPAPLEVPPEPAVSSGARDADDELTVDDLLREIEEAEDGDF